MVAPRCEIHGFDIDTERCSMCISATIFAQMMNGETPPATPERKTFVDDRGLRADGTGVIVWNQRLDDDLD